MGKRKSTSAILRRRLWSVPPIALAAPASFSATPSSNMMTWQVGAPTSDEQGNLVMESKKQADPVTSYAFLLEASKGTTTGQQEMPVADQTYDLRAKYRPSATAVNKTDSAWVYGTVAIDANDTYAAAGYAETNYSE